MVTIGTGETDGDCELPTIVQWLTRDKLDAQVALRGEARALTLDRRMVPDTNAEGEPLPYSTAVLFFDVPPPSSKLTRSVIIELSVALERISASRRRTDLIVRSQKIELARNIIETNT